jgi:hypothetical protein
MSHAPRCPDILDTLILDKSVRLSANTSYLYERNAFPEYSIFAVSSFMSLLIFCSEITIPWTVSNIDGKGFGLRATRKIILGEEVLAERPLLALPTEADRSRWESAIDSLPDALKDQFWRLFNAYPELRAYGIVKTNCFSLGGGAEEIQMNGLFLILSRLNHSCLPNCERWWQPARQVETLYALREIQVGEELTIHYADICARMSDRQACFQRVWRFDCKCEICQLEGNAQITSDVRRQSIRRIHLSAGVISHNAQLTRSVSQVKVAVRYLQEEGIRGSLMARVGYDGYQIALLANDLNQARVYINLAYNEYLLGAGPTSSDTLKMNHYLENPTSHRNWSFRRGFS